MAVPLPPLHPGDIVRIRSERWRIDRRLTSGDAELVEATGCDLGNRSAQAGFLLRFEIVDRLPVDRAPRIVRPRRWQHVARRVLAEATGSWASLRAAGRANLTLIPFQLEPALALLRGDANRILIADAVGLGKTIQSGLMIAEVLARQPDARVLVIAPAALRYQWRAELHSRFHLDAAMLDAGGVARLAADLSADVNPWSVPPVVITSIDYIKRPEVMRSLETLIWDLVILDEAHHLAGRSDRASAAAAIGERARALVLLTATPHSGDDDAFGRLCSVGNLNRGHPLLVFRRTRSDVGIGTSRRTTLLRVRVTPAETAMHAALMAYTRTVWNRTSGAGATGARLAMSVLTRRACSSAEAFARSVERRMSLLADPAADAISQPDLPFATETIEDEEPDGSLRWRGLDDTHEERVCLDRLLGLARTAAATESKLAVLRRLISRTTEPVIVFTEYRDTLRRIAAVLGDVDVVQLHGALTARERADAVRRFTGGDARLLLATDTASEGLNLHQRCRLVVNLELPWTPLRLDQRVGRVDRIGQARTVHAIHLVASHTCEESTLARLVRRIYRIRDAFGRCGPLPDEQRVAESALGNQPLPEIEAPRRSDGDGVADGVVTFASAADPRCREAGEETVRLTRARAWLDTSGSSRLEWRASIARLRRRRGIVGQRRCFWVFRMTVTNASGLVVWESLIPLSRKSAESPEGNIDVRSVLHLHPSVLSHVIDAAQARTLRDLRETLRQPLTLWMRRERDLMVAMRDRHARLSADLVQGALFDHRRERLAAAQAALLDEALSRSARRLDELAASLEVQSGAINLVFAAVVE